MKKKWLHTFKINRNVEKKETETKKDEKGEEVEVTKTVSEVTPTQFFLKKPNRKLYDDAELFYGVKMSEGIKAGLLTRNLLAKRYEDDGGAFSEAEKERYSDLYTEIYNKESEYQRLQLNLDNKTQELKEQISNNIIGELSELRRELVEIENSQSNIFDQTAENRAKNQTIMWWVLQLAHWQEHEALDIKNFFEGKTYEERLSSYDSYEDSDDEFFNEAIRKLAFFISFWYMGRATNDADFDAVEALYDEQNPSDEMTEEEVEAATREAEAEAVAEEAAQAEEKPKTKRKRAAKKKTKAKETEAAEVKAGETKTVEATEENVAPTAETEVGKTLENEVSKTSSPENQGEKNDE